MRQRRCDGAKHFNKNGQFQQVPGHLSEGMRPSGTPMVLSNSSGAGLFSSNAQILTIGEFMDFSPWDCRFGAGAGYLNDSSPEIMRPTGFPGRSQIPTQTQDKHPRAPVNLPFPLQIARAGFSPPTRIQPSQACLPPLIRRMTGAEKARVGSRAKAILPLFLMRSI